MKQLETYIRKTTLLQMPLFFFKKTNQQYICHEWSEGTVQYKLECNCKLGIPGAFENTVYESCIRAWVKRGMPEEGIETNYSEIATEMNLSGRDNNQRIKKAIEKLANARYKLTGLFATKEREYPFSLFCVAEIFSWEKGHSKKNSRLRLQLPAKIRECVDSRYYQMLDSSLYRSLSPGLTRRLYQYLEARRFENSNGHLVICEETICHWLPLMDKNTTTRRRTLGKIAQALVERGYLADHQFHRDQKQCVFAYRESMTLPLNTEPTAQRKITSEIQLQYCEALDWLDSIRYFYKKQKSKITTLPIEDVARCYLGIRQEYERRKATGKAPRPDWIINSFVERQLPDEQS